MIMMYSLILLLFIKLLTFIILYDKIIKVTKVATLAKATVLMSFLGIATFVLIAPARPIVLQGQDGRDGIQTRKSEWTRDSKSRAFVNFATLPHHRDGRQHFSKKRCLTVFRIFAPKIFFVNIISIILVKPGW